MVEKHQLMLWETASAEALSDAYLLGNGRIGAAVYGTVPDEKIAINEDTLWSGSERHYINKDAKEHLEEARRLVFERKFRDAEFLIQDKMLGTWGEAYAPLGNLRISMGQKFDEENIRQKRMGAESPANYLRSLDMKQAIAAVEYDIGDHHISREAFVSHPDQVLAVRVSSSAGPFDCFFSMDSEIRGEATVLDKSILLVGRAPDHCEPSFSKRNPTVAYLADGDSDSIRFASVARVTNTDGRVSNSEFRLFISGATYVEVLLAAATSYSGFRNTRNKDTRLLVDTCNSVLDDASSRSYSQLKDAHVRDYQRLFNRVSVDIGPETTGVLPTGERMAVQPGKIDDPSFSALAVQYARYLTISSSRPGTQPANLQGIWNDILRPPWSSNYTTNINVQMNYWPAEVLNLSECHEPLFDMVSEAAQSGAVTAREYFGLGGWTANHNIDLFRLTAPVSGSASFAWWPVGGAWLCQHLWTHYEYTLDMEFLRNVAYPIIVDAAEFLLDFLVEDEEGYLSTCPSTSPENFFINSDSHVDSEQILKLMSPRNRMGDQDATCSVSKSTTMDITLVREVFGNCTTAANVLGVKSDIHDRISQALPRLYPFKIGRHGQLQEWCFDFDECTPGMGHVSHMYGLFPGDIFTEEKAPDLYEACRASMLRRYAHGGGRRGWPGSWAIALFARLKESTLCGLIANSIYGNLGANLLTGSTYQIDCIFGLAAGVAEMLLQSHNGYIELLPALPASWTSGRISGFRARGGFEISFQWENRRISAASITSHQGSACAIKARGLVSVLKEGEKIETTAGEGESVSFPTEKRRRYALEFASG